uniref:Hyaluronidase n=1 Tax=Angiostrongylus cantonensis TaxID=6313 RepID=A0A0K0D226_ANGCA
MQLYSFSVHWNVPSETCLRNNIDLSLEKYGIKAHPDHIFYGDNVVIFYEHSFGLYPYFKKHNKSHPVNGGLPQNTDLKAHLVEVEKNITKLIPNENFTGFGVIDIEEWRPLFEQHFKNIKQVYQEASIDRVRATHPNLNDAEIRQRAENEFNEAAKKFIVETMKTARKMRPKAFWGIYGIPFCNYNAGKKDGDYSCSAQYKGFNEK